VLERAGLIARGRNAQWRPCRLEAGPLKDAAEWVETYRRFWDESYERLDEYLDELRRKERKHGRGRSGPVRRGLEPQGGQARRARKGAADGRTKR
jgi:hypothetical protein